MEKNVIPMRRKFRPNLSFFIFILIIIYVGVILYKFLMDDHISIYEVNATEISDDLPLYGFILRNEEVITADESGYVNYYYAEGSRVGTGKGVYTIDQSGEVNRVLEKLQENGKSDESVAAVRDVIFSFQNVFSMSDYQQVRTFSSTVNSVLSRNNSGSLYENMNEQMKKKGKESKYTKGISKKSGVISYSVDGYEAMTQKKITAELFDQYAGVTRTYIQNEEKVSAGDPVYRLVTSNEWALVAKVDDACYEKLKKLDYVRVTVFRDNISFNAGVKLFNQDNAHFAKLTTSRYMERYLNERFLKFEFDLNEAAGLKIPNSSIFTKEYYVVPESFVTSNQGKKGVVRQIVNERGKFDSVFVPVDADYYIDDNYYVLSSDLKGGDILMDSGSGDTFIVSSMQSLSGVYCVNNGFCEFRPIEIIYQNREYTIVSDTTKSGLVAFDHIVTDPSKLEDDDFIQ